MSRTFCFRYFFLLAMFLFGCVRPAQNSSTKPPTSVVADMAYLEEGTVPIPKAVYLEAYEEARKVIPVDEAENYLLRIEEEIAQEERIAR